MKLVNPLGRVAVVSVMLVAAGCGGKAKQKSTDFFTSGDREADQRASQRMAKTEQLRGTGEGTGEKKSEKAAAKVTAGEGGKAGAAGGAAAEASKSLYDRLGGEEAIKKIVDDFAQRALEDPRVNWDRKGVTYGGYGFGRSKSVQWDANEYNVGQLKKHIVQFLSLSTGGPAHYDGLEMKEAHAHKHITNSEFDAAVGDLKASLDKLAVPNKEQKELLSIVESTRPQVVEER